MKKQKAIRDRKKAINKKDISKDEFDKILKDFNEEINKIKIERNQLPKLLKQNIKANIEENKEDTICKHVSSKRICIRCKNNKMCNNCNCCTKCKKDISYYKGIEDNLIKDYSKIRIKVEHFFSHLKNGRMINVKDRKMHMLKDTIFNGITNSRHSWRIF